MKIQSTSEIENLEERIQIEKQFFRPVCNEDEIDRIFNVKNAKDELLKRRAETIVDHMRFFRVYRNRYLKNSKNWSLENSFNNSHYSNFLNKLPTSLQVKCKDITYGNIFSNDPNGSIFESKHGYGYIITISDAIFDFLKYMNLGLMNFQNDVPEHVAMNSIRIAIRVMLGTEALDFDMDPRGIIPENIEKAITAPISMQMQYIAGHEFCHYLLKHFDENNLIRKPIFKAISRSTEDYGFIECFNINQQQELEADLCSITLPNYSNIEKQLIFESALKWFACLEIFETADDYINPKMPHKPLTHPKAIDRYFHLLDKVETSLDFELEYWKEQLPNSIKVIQDWLKNDLAVNFDFYEIYGSAYLDEPNTKWRGKELIDRVDYY